MNPKKQTLLGVFSMLGFIVLWAVVTDAWNYSARLFPGHILHAGTYLYGYLSRLFWMLPAFILIRRFDQNLFWNKTQLFSRPKPEPVFFAFIVLTTIYALTFMIRNDHPRHITSGSLLLLTLKFLIVGVGEETVFRGWGCNLLMKVRSNAASLVISALLFVALHWPAYFIRLLLYGQFNWPGFAVQSISALFCGLLFAVMLKRSGTLWNPILAHFYYDWILEVLA